MGKLIVVEGTDCSGKETQTRLLVDRFEKENINYHLNYEKEQTFKNITTTITNNKYVIISKNANPSIHFVIKHPKLVEAIDNFNPLVKE